MSKICIYGIVIQLSIFTLAFAVDSGAQGKSMDEIRVTVNVLKPDKLSKVIAEIEASTDFHFSQIDQEVNTTQYTVSLETREYVLGDLLRNIAGQTDLSFHRVNTYIQIRKKEIGVASVVEEIQSGQTIKGTVTDENGEPLPGATIQVKGTTTGTITDVNGTFSLNVEEGAILQISFIGYLMQEIPVGAETTISVRLELDVENLEEVVVVGYGTQTKQEVNGAISSIKSDDVITSGYNTVQKSLQGRVAGVQVESSGGGPGSGVRILIRGTGSIGSNNPLYIVDGVQVTNIDNLSPSDIASMDILKDASAAAIYGSRAANGVVLITTKRGQSGELKIDFNSYVGVQKIINKLDVLNASQWATVSNMAHDNAGLDRLEIAQNPSSLGKGTDWQDQIYQTAPIQSYNLSASGGGETYSFSLSGGYIDQDGIVKTTNYNRYNFRAKSEFSKGRITLGETVIFTKEYWRNASGGFGGQGGNPVGSSTKMIPVFEVYDPTAVGGFSGASGPVVNIENPLAILHLQKPEVYTNRILVNTYAQVKILEGLSYKFNMGYTNTTNFNSTFTYPYQMGSLFTNENADMSESRDETNYSLLENTLNYDKSFSRSRVRALVGYTFQETKYRYLGGSKSGMPSNVQVLDAGSVNPAAGSNASEATLVSYLARLIYSFDDDRFVLTGIIRRDGSSRFGPDNRFGNFPSIAGAWNLTNEDFFQALPTFISAAKLRASYGVLGNQDFANYQYSPQIALNTNYVVGVDQQLWPGATQTAFATPDVKWESAKTFNVGTDLGFFDYQLQFSADYFIKQNSDLILQVPVPLSTGASSSSPYVNAGQITNKGLELALNYQHVSQGDFRYELTGTFTAIHNNVDNLGTGSQQIFGGQPTHHDASATVTQAGYPVGAFYLIKTNGIFQSQAEVDAYTHNGEKIQPNAQPGDICFVDYNNDGQIDQSDRQYLGSPTPKFSYGFGGNVWWKGFDLQLYFQGTHGNKIYNGVRQGLEGMNLEQNYALSTLHAWTPENPNTHMPRAVINDPNLNSQTSDRFLEDGSYLRLRSLQIGYSIPGVLLDRAKINSFRIYLSLNNLFTITKYKSYNPDLGRSGSVLDRGVDYGEVAYPLSRTSMLGVQISF